MNKKEISNGTVHKVPADLSKIIASNKVIQEIWNTLTALARNEWICWIESAKKLETRNRRINIMLDKLPLGKHRPCCWAGCGHRGK